jgi:hypothetical protein
MKDMYFFPLSPAPAPTPSPAKPASFKRTKEKTRRNRLLIKGGRKWYRPCANEISR